MKTLIAALLIALPSVAAQSLSVELRSRLPDVETMTLAEHVRDVAERTLPDASIVDSGPADLAVSGDILRTEKGFLVTLELRETGSSRLGATASAPASTPEELVDAVASASVDLFRAWKETSALSMTPAPVPEPPSSSGAIKPAGMVSLDVNADLLVAFDEARAADAQGKDKPEDAAAAWRVVAESGGQNPFREAAAERARQWEDWAGNKRAFEEQRSKDTARMRKVLPLAAVTDETKIALMVRYTHAYGLDRSALLIGILPAPLRTRGDYAIGCEAKQAQNCVALASITADPAQAIEWLGRACTIGDAGSCAEAGDRWLQKPTRDVSRAIPALEIGCAASSARACVRMARVYEEGDGTDMNPPLAATMRDRACTAGDGASCRKLACAATDTKAASALWSKGCQSGDTLSCTLASISSPTKAGVTVPPTKAPAPATHGRAGAGAHPVAGATFLGVALVAGTGAAILAMSGDPQYDSRWGWHPHALTMATRDGRGGSPRVLPVALGAVAAVSAVAGGALLFWHSEKVDAGVSPSGVVLTGKLP